MSSGTTGSTLVGTAGFESTLSESSSSVFLDFNFGLESVLPLGSADFSFRLLFDAFLSRLAFDSLF